MDSTNILTGLYLSSLAVIIFNLVSLKLSTTIYGGRVMFQATYFGLINCVFELFIYIGIWTCTESLLAVFKLIYAVWIKYQAFS